MEVSNSEGQSFFEVVIAMALVSVILISLISLATLSIKASVFSRNQTEASSFSEEGIEWLVAEKNASWTVFKNHTATATWCLDTKTWTKPRACTSADIISGTVFVRNVTFTPNSDGTIAGDVTTTWDDGTQTHTIESSTIFADTR